MSRAAGGKHGRRRPCAGAARVLWATAELDRYWDALGDGGTVEECGWVRDRYGVAWQVVPRVLGEHMKARDRAAARRVVEAMLKMKKLDIAGLEAAYRGRAA